MNSKEILNQKLSPVLEEINDVLLSIFFRSQKYEQQNKAVADLQTKNEALST